MLPVALFALSRLTNVPGAGRVVLLCDVRTPAVLIDMDVVPDAFSLLAAGDSLGTLEDELRGAVYLHTRVTRRIIDLTRAGATGSLGGGRYHRDASYAIATLDAAFPPDGAFLAMGLNNHWDADYYWARSAGKNSNRPAPGIGVRVGSDGFAQVVRLSEVEAEAAHAGGERIQPNDGKWSEWVEFLKPGDEVDLVPDSPMAVIREAPAGRVLGVSRAWRPLGAEPYVSAEWPTIKLGLGDRS
jgi:hypothetical protein